MHGEHPLRIALFEKINQQQITILLRMRFTLLWWRYALVSCRFILPFFRRFPCPGSHRRAYRA